MPFYEYQCSNCGHQLEAMQKITDAPLRKCPECGRLALKKLLSAPVFRLKGSGWYETDFKSDKEQKRNLVDERKDEEKKEAPKDESKSKEEPKGEAKADPKAEPKTGPKAESKSKAKPRAKPKTRPRAKVARKGRR
ncbi:MAG: hypothetical protein KF790_06615 [Steroidobacteraceae bacterium]|nr:hypothetical protein [Steroidobacteraceae bacterium]